MSLPSPGRSIASLLAFGLLSLALGLPALVVAAFTSDSALCARVVGPVLCPAGSTPRPHRYATTSHSRTGGSRAATASELRCVDDEGGEVARFRIAHAALWTALLVGTALGGAALGAAVAGRIFARRAGRTP